MTRKHFEVIVLVLRQVQPQGGGMDASLKHSQWRTDRCAIADAPQLMCPNFNRLQFLDACNGKL